MGKFVARMREIVDMEVFEEVNHEQDKRKGDE